MAAQARKEHQKKKLTENEMTKILESALQTLQNNEH